MNHTKRTFIVGIALMALSATAFAQPGPRNRGSDRVAEAVTEAFGLTEEQVEQIREIRQDRPERGQSREEIATWREGQQEKIQAVLTDEQKGKIAELVAARDTMRALAGASALGLVPSDRGGPGFGSWQNRARQGDNRTRSGRSRRGTDRGARGKRGSDRGDRGRRGSDRSDRGRRGSGRR